MVQFRFRLGLAAIALGGVAYLVALSAGTGTPGYAPAPALVAVGLSVHLPDPVLRRRPAASAGMALAIVCAATDATLSALDRGGLLTTLTTLGVAAGILVAVVARRSA